MRGAQVAEARVGLRQEAVDDGDVGASQRVDECVLQRDATTVKIKTISEGESGDWSLTAWNLTCSATLRFFSPPPADVNVLRMLDTRRRLPVFSPPPTMEPVSVVGRAEVRNVEKRMLTSSLSMNTATRDGCFS